MKFWLKLVHLIKGRFEHAMLEFETRDDMESFGSANSMGTMEQTYKVWLKNASKKTATQLE